jgi:hypothetical protein
MTIRRAKTISKQDTCTYHFSIHNLLKKLPQKFFTKNQSYKRKFYFLCKNFSGNGEVLCQNPLQFAKDFGWGNPENPFFAKILGANSL